MNAKQVLTFGVTLFLALLGAVAMGEAMAQQHIQIAKIDVNPTQLESYKAAVQEQIEAAVCLERASSFSTRCPTRTIQPISRCSRSTATGTPIWRICRRPIS